MVRKFVFCLSILSVISCSKKVNKPNFIDFKIENDSIYVLSKNKLVCPIYIKIIDRKTSKEQHKQLDAKGQSVILKYSKQEMDTLKILEKYKFLGYYGQYNFKGYDTSYNYALPFVKGYTSNVIQGYDSDYSHYGTFSAKSLDFDMAIGDTITASRSGIVISKVIKHNKQGASEDFKEYGNFLLIYHKDNTFSQYVHLKQNGNLVDVGDTIKKNQPIALSGFTGWTTTPHLHFGVYKPTKNGLESIPILIDSISAKTLKRGDIIINK